MSATVSTGPARYGFTSETSGTTLEVTHHEFFFGAYVAKTWRPLSGPAPDMFAPKVFVAVEAK